ncbi:hypothetical protein EVAR_72999_1 [Eumeta japonica]|uniref:Uncharacterized protein n=1 Tax=Eumeta variegata TaxID=151549 RepID=A0A4C1TCN8_EUMVA|nr:hypothetical protein EVAR_72999_1 [Eumeta japonica]
MPSFMPVEPTETSQFQTNATVAGQQLSNSCPPGTNCSGIFCPLNEVADLFLILPGQIEAVAGSGIEAESQTEPRAESKVETVRDRIVEPDRKACLVLE